MPSPRHRRRVGVSTESRGGLFDVGCYGVDADIIDVVEVVAEIELGEPEGDEEASVICC